MPHAAISPTQVLMKRTSRHRRTASIDILPSIHRRQSSTSSTTPGKVQDKPWQFDDTSDEEVPVPTLLETALRQARARAHVETRLGDLRIERFAEERVESLPKSNCACELLSTHEGFMLLGHENLGCICPRDWRPAGIEGMLLDRTWLHVINPLMFDEKGVLREPHLYMKRPKQIPLLYWKWLKGEDPIRGEPERWAQGWSAEGPTIEWVSRWRNDELTAKEIAGRRRVGFVLEEEFWDNEHL